MEAAVITTYRDPEHIYSKRSCALCLLWESCRYGLKRPTNAHADYARYGCNGFYSNDPALMSEPPMQQKERRKYLNKEN